MESKLKKTNIAERVKKLLASFVHSNDTPTAEELSETRTAKSALVVANQSSSVLSTLPKTSTRHEAFIRRIEGFTTLAWFGKPVQLSPVRCARYGWENTAKDVLQCVTCKRILCCSLPSPSSDSYAKEVGLLENKLVQSHRENCSWRVNPCQGICLSELVSDRQSAIAQFISRLLSLNIACELPPVDLTVMEQQESSWNIYVIEQLKQLLKDSSVSGILGLKDVGTTACVIALCGWAIRSENPDILVCTYCSRKIGVWKYIRKNDDSKCDDVNVSGDGVNENGDNVGQEHRIKKRKKSVIEDKFDPVNEHKYWCAWLLAASEDEQKFQEAVVKSVTESADQDCLKTPIAGWKWYLYTLLPDLNPDSVRTCHRLIGDVKTTPPYEGLRNIRHILSGWVSTEDLTVDLEKTRSPEKDQIKENKAFVDLKPSHP